MNSLTAFLELEDGTRFPGQSFGYEGPAAGELVFNTAMTGYPESLSDPSYAGQILVLTYPLIGNYGVPAMAEGNLPENFESEKVQISGLIVSEYSHDFNHWNAAMSLSDWLKAHRVPALQGLDTRALTQRIREGGALKARILVGEDRVDFIDTDEINLVAQVSLPERKVYGKGALRVLLIDCGVKHNIIRHLVKRGVEVVRVPWDYDISREEYDGILVSNGPGNPVHCTSTIQSLAGAMQGSKPIFGICLGNQLLALASGARTYKLKYGHRGHNQPVLMVDSHRAFITSQNHGFAIDQESLPSEWKPWFINLNDGTNEGMRHQDKPFFSVQFHPEASSGPTDTEFLFDAFIDEMERRRI
jgi:carbamoyl-phosphate synthase small subunit